MGFIHLHLRCPTKTTIQPDKTKVITDCAEYYLRAPFCHRK